MASQMTLVRVEAQTTAVIRARVRMSDIPGAIMPMVDRVWAFIRGAGLTGHGHNVWLYRSADQGEVDVEIGVQLAPPFDGEDDVVPSQTPAGLAAHTVHYGAYDRLPQVHATLLAWCAEQGHELTGLSWEVYGDWAEDPAKRRTDVYHLCANSEDNP